MFHFIASTGRTATTFLAAFLDALEGVTGCHEGYQGSLKDRDPLLPVINLENSLCYRDPGKVRSVVADKRSSDIIESALALTGDDCLVDVAYYNAMIASGLLARHKDARMTAIIRDCESFVRSATCINGEDPMPVGWPDPEKPLTEREKFISLGRIKPARGSDEQSEWPSWSAVQRNIWLWAATNRRILEAAIEYGNRAQVLEFSGLKAGKEDFLRKILDFLDLATPDDLDQVISACEQHQNSKPSGYQIGPSSTWTVAEAQMLEYAQQEIDGLLHHVRTY